MSTDNNNNSLRDNNRDNTSYYNEFYSEDTYTGQTWNGSNSDDNFNGTSSSYYSDGNYSSSGARSSASYGYSGSVSKVGFEENVLAQSFMFMTVALVITAFTALYVYNSPSLLYNIIFNDAIFYGLLFAEIAVVIIANITVSKNLIVPSAIMFTLYSVINGATLSVIFLAYTGTSIVSTFFITAGMFGVMAVYGMFTKKNLSSIGSLCMMGLIGIIIAGIVNMVFLQSTGLELAISVIGIFIFVGLTAYDVQKIKLMINTTTSENITCIALLGALELYLDFINIFLKLLRLLGRSRD